MVQVNLINVRVPHPVIRDCARFQSDLTIRVAAASFRIGLFSAAALISRKSQRAGDLEMRGDQTWLHFQNDKKLFILC
jgi:hypothetical protein